MTQNDQLGEFAKRNQEVREQKIDDILDLISTGCAVKLHVEYDVFLTEDYTPRVPTEKLRARLDDQRQTIPVGLLDEWKVETARLRLKVEELQADNAEVGDKNDRLWEKTENHQVMYDELVNLRAENKLLTEQVEQYEKPAEQKYAKRLTNEQVWQIRRFIKMGRENSWIAMHLEMKVAVINKVRKGYTYAEVPPEPERKPVSVVAGKGEMSNEN